MLIRSIAIFSSLALAQCTASPEYPSTEPQETVAQSEPTNEATLAPVANTEPSQADRALRFMQITDAAGPAFVIAEHAENSWSAGTPTIEADHDGWVIRRSLSREFPADLAALEGRTMHLADAHGDLCFAQIGAISVVAMYGSDSVFRLLDEGEDEPSLTSATAQRGWDGSEGESRVLVASVIPVSGNCIGAKWAHSTERAMPEHVAVVDATDDVRSAALRTLHETVEYQQAQHDFEAQDHPGVGPWDETSGSTTVRVARRANGISYVWVTARAGDGCGDFGGFATGVYRQMYDPRGRVELIPMTANEGVPEVAPEAGIDTDGDGTLEWLLDDGMLQHGGDDGEVTGAIRIMGGECGC